MAAAAYLDPGTGRTWPLEAPRWRSDDGAPLLITALTGMSRSRIDTTERSLWRYRASFPFVPDRPISLGEGMTPLSRRSFRGVDVWLKCDWMNPTGSFKDRGASVMLSLLRAQGISHVLEDSSGNGGAAVAGYAAAGGMRATIMTPASTSPAKTVQMRDYGAEIRLIPGSRQDTADAAVSAADSIFYASHNWHPFFLQGTKTLAYELWEDFGFETPDNIVMPCGAGSNVLGCDIGFAELMRAGEIARSPRLFAVQPANCGPIAAAFLAGTDQEVATAVEPTIAEGTAIARPIRLREVIGALRASHGGAVLVSEQEIMAAFDELARGGIYVEPTSAQVLAGYFKLLESGAIAPDDRTVLQMTGSGLKATGRIAEHMGITA